MESKLKKVKLESKKVNKSFFTKSNITEQNYPIYAGAKLVYDKISITLMNSNNFSWEKRLEGQIKKPREQAKAQKKEKHTRTK